MNVIGEVCVKSKNVDAITFFFVCFFCCRPACGTKRRGFFLSAEGAFKFFFALSYGFRFSLPPWVILPDRLKWLSNIACTGVNWNWLIFWTWLSLYNLAVCKAPRESLSEGYVNFSFPRRGAPHRDTRLDSFFSPAMTAFSPVKLHGRNNAPWPVIISAERTLFLRVFIGVSVSREECSACFIKTTRKPVTAVGFLNDDGWPRFSVPRAKMCCNVAPYQCHGLGDYFGALWSAWLLNLSSPQTALCLGYTVTPSAICIHQLVKNGPLFQPGSQKQQRRVIPCYEISTMTIPLVQIGAPASAVLTGFAPLPRRRNLARRHMFHEFMSAVCHFWTVVLQ